MLKILFSFKVLNKAFKAFGMSFTSDANFYGKVLSLRSFTREKRHSIIVRSLLKEVHFFVKGRQSD